LDLVRASVDRRGQKVSGGAYRNDDYYRIRIVMCLFANKELNRSQMLTNSEFGLNRMERGRLTLLLEKMVSVGWINSFSTKYSQNIITYSLDEKGLSMAKTLQEFNEKHPIFDLESFNAIKLLGLQDA